MKEMDHSEHGRGTAESGPDYPDCDCRGTAYEAACANSGCGFCGAVLERRTPQRHEDASYCISYSPLGFRDVWWCYIINEPSVLTYKNGIPVCPGCGFEAVRGKGPSDIDFEDGRHTFICHIGKPVKSREYVGDERGTH